MRIAALDHLALTVQDVDGVVAFYERLGLRHDLFEDGRHALSLGDQKINLNVVGMGEPRPVQPSVGSAHLCFLVDELDVGGLDVVLGPVERTGATGRIRSVYLHDPDGNLVELSTPL
jgi:catechol 2,3-dioxygenase-like lactoylglutathione lyase family enzyme